VKDSRPCGSYAWRVGSSDVSKEFIEEFYGAPEAIQLVQTSWRREEGGIRRGHGLWLSEFDRVLMMTQHLDLVLDNMTYA
jgi:hypothetical protein